MRMNNRWTLRGLMATLVLVGAILAPVIALELCPDTCSCLGAGEAKDLGYGKRSHVTGR